ncbi:MAG: hypothetical protein ABEJ64_00125 [Candidatus Nanohaloarchaea archaeon]
MKSTSFHRRKGQSAIEYLMTYGWMLLVVAIVGGAIFATVQGQCSKQNGLASTPVAIAEFGATDTGLNLQIKNNKREQVTLNAVNITSDGTSIASQTGIGTTLRAGDTTSVSFPAITSSDACTSYDVEIEYTAGVAQQVSGTIKDKMSS